MIVVQIEGNIGSGKSTFIKYFKEKLCQEKNTKLTNLKIKFIDEPLSDWMNINNYNNSKNIVDNNCNINNDNDNNNNYNIFNLYYKNPKQYSELFQTFAFFTLLNVNLKNYFENVDLIIMERSLYTSVYCFIKLLLDKEYVTPIFCTMMENVFEKFKDKIIHPNIVVYFKADDMDILMKRIQNRGRVEEKSITKQYLTNLNDKYNEYINTHFKEIKKCIIPVNTITTKTEEELELKYFNDVKNNILEMLE